MLALIEIQWWHYAGFVILILLFLSLDLGVFHRKAHVVSFKEAFAWTTVWCCLALLFALGLRPLRGNASALDFLNGYLIELSLSMDNVFVMAVIFNYFKVPPLYQHRVLFWGVLGAFVMRGLMIGVGVELIHSYQWMLYVFGIFLVLTGIKMVVADEEDLCPEKNPLLRLAQRHFPVSTEYDGQKFLTFAGGRLALTPLALVLILVESTDLVLALDSIPAILGVTTDSFIVFTSNVFAILGLRSLYFVLAGAIAYFRYLKIGLAVVLGFIGFKMIVVDWVKIPSSVSLPIVLAIIGISILLSLIRAWRDPGAGTPSDPCAKA